MVFAYGILLCQINNILFMTLPKHLYVADSKIHGIGLFTKIPFKKGDICFTAERQIVRIDDPDVPVGYIDQHAIVPRIHSPQIAPNMYHVYSFDSFMNHSEHPNTKVIYIDELSYHHLALRDIKASEELTVSYDEVYSAMYPDQDAKKYKN